jgi:hypothetical protein
VRARACVPFPGVTQEKQQRFMRERFLQEQDGALHAHAHEIEGEEEKGGARERKTVTDDQIQRD